jgi:hypothetical protein
MSPPLLSQFSMSIYHREDTLSRSCPPSPRGGLVPGQARSVGTWQATTRRHILVYCPRCSRYFRTSKAMACESRIYVESGTWDTRHAGGRLRSHTACRLGHLSHIPVWGRCFWIQSYAQRLTLSILVGILIEVSFNLVSRPREDIYSVLTSRITWHTCTVGKYPMKTIVIVGEVDS